MCQRLPAATETDDLGIVFAAAVGNGFYDRVEARDVAAASEDADLLFRHDDPFTALSWASGPWPWGSRNPARGTPRGGVPAVSYFTNLGLRLSRMTLAPCLRMIATFGQRLSAAS